MSVKTDLAKMKKAWKKAETREGFPTVPDGTYECRIDAATVAKSKGTTKRLQVGFQLTIVSGDQANRKLNKYDGIETEENIEWLKGSLASLDVDVPDDISELPDVLASLEGTGCEVTVKTKDEFQNVYFNGPIELDDAEDEDDEEEEDEDEEDEDDDDEDEEDDDEDEDDEDEDDDDDEEEEEEEAPKTRRKKSAPKKSKKKPKKKASRRSKKK